MGSGQGQPCPSTRGFLCLCLRVACALRKLCLTLLMLCCMHLRAQEGSEKNPWGNPTPRRSALAPGAAPLLAAEGAALAAAFLGAGCATDDAAVLIRLMRLLVAPLEAWDSAQDERVRCVRGYYPKGPT